MLAAAQRSGVLHALCHNYRRAPAVQLAKQYVAEGRLGRIHHFRGTYLQDWIVDPAFPLVWRLQKERAGSGALGDIASHSIDLARFLVGEIAEVSGLLETFVRERPLEGGAGRGPVTVDDAALALVRFANGAIGSIEGSRFCPGRKNHNRFEINGSRGSLAFDLERLNELEIYEEQGPDSGFRRVLATEAAHPFVSAWWPPGHVLGWEHTFIHTLADLLHALAGTQTASPDFADGVRNQRVLDAIERSARSRAWISLS
jgi:predicted dehydrogenase